MTNKRKREYITLTDREGEVLRAYVRARWNEGTWCSVFSKNHKQRALDHTTKCFKHLYWLLGRRIGEQYKGWRIVEFTPLNGIVAREANRSKNPFYVLIEEPNE